MSTENERPMTREEKLSSVKKYLDMEGFSPEDLKTIQEAQHVVTDKTKATASAIVPSEIEGTSNIVTKDASQLTSELAELTRRFNNLVAAHYSGNF